LCSSWVDITFIVSSSVRGPAMGLFMGKRPPGSQPDCQTDYTVTRCGPEVDGSGGLRAASILERPCRARHGGKTILLIINAKVVQWKNNNL
jgi:hypothetical protein